MADEPGPSHVDHATVSEKYKQNVRRFKTTGTAYDVTFQNLDGVQDVQTLARDTIQVSLFSILKGLQNTSYV